jgi:hypothetical protein
MTNIKMFMDSSPDELEQKVNEWLGANQSVEVLQITTDFASVLETTGSGTTYWTGASYCTLLYKS